MSGDEVSIILIGQDIAMVSWAQVIAEVDLRWHEVSKDMVCVSLYSSTVKILGLSIEPSFGPPPISFSCLSEYEEQSFKPALRQLWDDD